MAKRSFREAERAFVVEGAKVLGEALGAGAGVESVYLDPAGAGPLEDALVQRCLAAGARVFDLEDGVLERVAATVNPQPIMAVVRSPDMGLDELARRCPTLVVVCAGVRDPGNAGTVLRSAAAAGADGVVACGGSVDLFNPKTVRASAGALFAIAVATGGEAVDVLSTLAAWGLRRWGSVARGGEEYTSVDLTGPTAVVVGNEASGLAPESRPHLDGLLTIPMARCAESLNVATAAAVVCFEAARQRRLVRPEARPGVPR